MIACVSPADSNMEETANTLRYADRARKIKNKPIVNIDPQAAELASLRQQVQDLKAQLLRVTGGTLPNMYNWCFFIFFSISLFIIFLRCIENTVEINSIKEENEKLKAEVNKLVGELQRLIHINRITYEKMTKSEQDKEDLQKKFEEIKSLFGTLSKSCENQDNKNNLDSSMLKDLQEKLNEFEKSNVEQAQEQNQDISNEMMNEVLLL